MIYSSYALSGGGKVFNSVSVAGTFILDLDVYGTRDRLWKDSIYFGRYKLYPVISALKYFIAIYPYKTSVISHSYFPGSNGITTSNIPTLSSDISLLQVLRYISPGKPQFQQEFPYYQLKKYLDTISHMKSVPLLSTPPLISTVHGGEKAVQNGQMEQILPLLTYKSEYDKNFQHYSF